MILWGGNKCTLHSKLLGSAIYTDISHLFIMSTARLLPRPCLSWLWTYIQDIMGPPFRSCMFRCSWYMSRSGPANLQVERAGGFTSPSLCSHSPDDLFFWGQSPVAHMHTPTHTPTHTQIESRKNLPKGIANIPNVFALWVWEKQRGQCNCCRVNKED